VPLAPLPDFIRKSLEADAKRREQHGPPVEARPFAGSVSAWARKVIDNELDRLRNAPEGQRNQTFAEVSFKLGQLAAGGEAGVNDLIASLYHVADSWPSPSKSRGTIDRCFDAGQGHPRRSPSRPYKGAPHIERVHNSQTRGDDGVPHSDSTERITDLQGALKRLVDFEPQLRNDITFAHSADFLGAAVILFESDSQAYNGLYTRLKAKGVRASEFEREVKALASKRKKERDAAAAEQAKHSDAMGLAGSGLDLRTPDLWAEAVEGKQLLDDIVTLLKKYLVLPALTYIAIALWVVHTYMLEATETAARLSIISPEKRCGKTRVLSVLAQLTPRSLAASNISTASLFRTIEAWQPTLLIDEADTFLDENDEIRGVLNSGHTRPTAFVVRAVGDNHEPRKFSTWASIAIAAIHKRTRQLPDTLLDRSVIVRMQRKKRTDRGSRFDRRARQSSEFQTLRSKIARWAADNLDAAKNAAPLLPADLDDRAVDNWEPLLVIADLADPHKTGWSMLARTAAISLSGSTRDESEDGTTSGILLLGDLRDLFTTTSEQVDLDKNEGKQVFSADIIEALHQLEERPWREYGRSRKPISQRQLADLLRPYEIVSGTVRVGKETGKGYKAKDCQEAFERYLPPLKPKEENPERIEA
jgi:hypothetical protein